MLTCPTPAATARTQGTQGTHAYCPDHHPAESTPDYAQRVLAYACVQGLGSLSLSQLELADMAAQRAVAALPAHLDADAIRLDAHLHTLRLRLACRIGQRRRQLAACQRLLDELDETPPPDGIEAQGGADTAEVESDADRATRLLKAALLLIMGPTGPTDRGNGGGRPAALIRPTPTRPPSGGALDPRRPDPQRPNLPPRDGINF